jgi:DNA-binding response OmpR family regulator
MMSLILPLHYRQGLEDDGFDVNAFIDPELVLSSFKPGLYDLVLNDIMMPKMDGFELYERLETVDPDIKVCFLTASEFYREEIREVLRFFDSSHHPTPALLRLENHYCCYLLC